tara:strand:+ start:848 stop:1165 length:318 start_codon:yes stop_codon:yes gene_type:complete
MSYENVEINNNGLPSKGICPKLTKYFKQKKQIFKNIILENNGGIALGPSGHFEQAETIYLSHNHSAPNQIIWENGKLNDQGFVKKIKHTKLKIKQGGLLYTYKWV